MLVKHPIYNWRVIAFKPPNDIDFVTNYEGLEVVPKKLWFLPLDNESNPKMLGLRIGFKNFDSKEEKKFLNASYQILDSILGEKYNASNIDYVEVFKLPDNPEKEGLIELSELLEYIEWRKYKIN